MAGTETLGEVITCNLTRTEDDTDDLVLVLKSGGVDIGDATGWTGLLSIGADKDATPTVTFAGAGIATNGQVVFDMNTFALPIGSYKYDIRITDTNTGDAPSRVYVKGSFKVTARIN